MDPIGLAGGLNLYGYANGDPINYSDPFGLCQKKRADGKECNQKTGDKNLDDPNTRQALEDAANAPKPSSEYPGYQNEVAGWCAAASCTSDEGNLVSSTAGPRISNAELVYHTHPSAGMDDPRPGQQGMYFPDRPSRADVRNAAEPRRAGVNTYIVSPNSIYRLSVDGRGNVSTSCFQRWSGSTTGCSP